MKRSTLAFLLTIVIGIAGIFIGAMLNAEGYIGNVLAIAVMGFFIIRAIEDNQERKQ